MNKIEKMLCVLLLAMITIPIASAEGTETLGIPGISISTGSGIVASGTGLVTQPGTISINIPTDSRIKQVLLYWEGQHTTAANGDNTIKINNNVVTGTKIGGPTLFFSNIRSSSYRADITGLNIVQVGPNVVTVEGLSFNNKNNGAGIIVIFEKGPLSDIQIRDGNDLAYHRFAPPLDTTVPQTFTFEPATTNRVASLSMFFSSIFQEGRGFRPTVIEINVDGNLIKKIDALNSNDGQEWDTLTVSVNIPAGATSLRVQALSKNEGQTDGDPASLAWTAAALSVPNVPTTTPTPTPTPINKGRMTGGGSVFKEDMRVTHGFEIRCNLKKPNNLEVNWPGNKFHLSDLTFAACTDDPSINPKPPKAPFDTFTGKGNGKLNGVSGAKIEFVFTDAGEPGTKDTATMKISDKNGNVVLEVSGKLKKGNHQAHK